MATSLHAAALRVSKKTLSMFLRTRCDKELFLSLHDPLGMVGFGLPEPIKRPGIGVLSVQGREFEVERNDLLVQLFPGIIEYSKVGSSYVDKDLRNELAALTTVPKLILQGRFSIGTQQAVVLGNIGLSNREVGVIPPVADFIPDVVYVRKANSHDVEIRPDGTRQKIDPATEVRYALSILDIKHTAEANPSYCSEIAMYALMMANWLALNPELHSRYFVTTQAFLWTRSKQGESQIELLQNQGRTSQDQLLDALMSDSEDAQLRFYLTAIRGFFEDVARVVQIGSTQLDGWRNLDWHVASPCGSCDWLGDKRHMSTDGRAKVDAHPDHYCMPLAEASGHLCLVPGVTRGAKKVLCQNAVPDASGLATAAGHPALQQHTLLKREAKTLPARSAAIMTGTTSLDQGGAIASLVKNANILLYASVNFDSSSGLLTGLALSGTATNFTVGHSPRRFTPTPFVVDQKTLAAEWVALEGFLTQISSCIDSAERLLALGDSATGQIHFWEQRQFHELCNAMGRHLPQVMALSDRRAKALAWLFPAEDMIARADALDAATITVVDEVVKRLVFAPTRHVITLFDTVEQYNSSSMRTISDPYYREYLSNGIPRERIYEIWSNTPQVKRGTNHIPRNTLISQYADALNKQCTALENLCQKLRSDFSGNFRARATHIPTSIPRGAQSVAFDSKLWIWWDNLNFNTSQLEAHIKLSMDGERLEATYEAIVLKNGVHVAGELYDFDVAPGSTEAKFKEDSVLTLGKVGHPGVPLQRLINLLPPVAPKYHGNEEILQRPLWSVLKATIISFNRQNARARVQLSIDGEPQMVPYLISHSVFPLLHDIFLVEAKKPKPFNWAVHSTPIFSAIGNPRIATPDPNAIRSMGISPPARRGTSSPETPAARVLWNPSSLEQKIIVPAATSQILAKQISVTERLNQSQEMAVAHAIERGLTLIWGPPGTGKTQTLSAMLHAMVAHAVSQNQPLKILISGPTYKAVEEVVSRAAKSMSSNPSAPCQVFMGYSEGRTPPSIPASLQGHVDYRTMFFAPGCAEYSNCLTELEHGPGVTIVGCQIRQARKFSKEIGQTPIHEVFDVVVIDESSQVPVSHSVAAFSGLKEDARLIIAGDHLQMPPITSVLAPANAEYLVGSIQTYLSIRPFQNAIGHCVLERNYRSNEDIVSFARSIGYPSSLSAEYPQTSLHLLQSLPTQNIYPGHLPWCADFDRILYPETKVATLLHEDDISSQGNRYEAQVVAGLVWMLRQVVSAELDGRNYTPTHRLTNAQEFWSKSIGIVTPHRAQRALVVQELEKLWPTEVDLISDAVDTVERFQGGERHSIIVTFGVADVDVIGGEEAFLMQLERTNVAVSRAMAKCIVVMPDTLALHIPEDKRALETAYALKDYIEEFCNQRTVTTLTLGGDSRQAEVRIRR